MNDIITQGSPEWFAVRLGKVTASRIADMTARTKSGWGASRANYAAELIAERLTGNVAVGYTNAAMQWGKDMEPEARAAYEFYCGEDVTEISFIDHPKIPMTGASPDGLVGKQGLVEFKCPATATHSETLRGAEIDGKYIKQMQWQMACANRQWCDWASFDPRMPENMRLFVRRVKRDDAMIAGLEKDVRDFLTEIDATIADLTKRYGAQAA